MGRRRLALLFTALALICGCAFTTTGAMADVVDDDPAAASTGLGNMSIAMRDSGGNLVTRAWAGSQWSPWSAVTSLQLTSGPSMSIRPGPIVDVFARGPDNAIYHTYYTAAGGWSAWGSLGGCLTSAPASSWRGNGYLDVVAVGCDGQVYMKNWNASTGWTQWFSLGGSIIYKPAIKSYANGTISVYAVGTDHQLYQNYYNGSWSGWMLVAAGYLTSGPSLSNQTEGTIDVFARDQNGNIAQKSYNGFNWSDWGWIATNATSAPAAAAEGPGRVSLFVRGGGDLYTNQFASGAWSGWTSQFPFYPTSWNYGGADHSVNTDAEANALISQLSANDGSGAKALLDGLTPANSVWLKNNYLLNGLSSGPSPSGPRDPASDETDPSEATSAATNLSCQKEQDFKIGVYKDTNTPLMQLRWDVKYCTATNGTIHHVATIFQGASISGGWKKSGSMTAYGSWEGDYGYRRQLSQDFELCGGSNAGVNIAGSGISLGSDGCLTMTLALDRTVFADRLWHPNSNDSATFGNKVADRSNPVGLCSGGSCRSL